MTAESGVVNLSGKTSYFPGLTNTGARGAVLIDPGTDEEEYLRFAADTVLVTHGHADHFSSAAVLRRAGSRIVAPREEASMIENPEVNIRGMFSWAKPSDEMVTKLFRGEGCQVDEYVDRWHDDEIQTIPLSGHTLGHTGFLTEDGVLFTGDALYVRDLWDKHPLPYAIDVALVRVSLGLIESLQADWIVPGHGELVRGDAVVGHVRHHLARLDAISDALLDILREPSTTEDAIAGLCATLGLLESPAQYWLAVTTVKAFLADLLQQEVAEFFVADHRGYWRAL